MSTPKRILALIIKINGRIHMQCEEWKIHEMIRLSYSIKHTLDLIESERIFYRWLWVGKGSIGW